MAVTDNKKIDMTHSELVIRGARWLSDNYRPHCQTVIFERVSRCQRTNEIPDVIGWHGSQSHLLEVKVSRADFLTDKNKRFRREELSQEGMGCLRYYLCPNKLIMPDEIPENWGLLYATEHQIRYAKPAQIHENYNLFGEIGLLSRAVTLSKTGVIINAPYDNSPVEIDSTE